MLLAGLVVLVQRPEGGASGALPPLLALYTLLALAIMALLPRAAAQPGGSLARMQALVLAAFLLDVAATSLLVYESGGLESDLYLLFVLLAFRAAILAPAQPRLLFLPFAFGPLYVALLWLRLERLSFLLDSGFLVRYGLLFAAVAAATYVGWMIEETQARVARLGLRLGQKSQDLEQKTLVLQQTATSLGDRLMELRSLQEGVKAINAALAIDETLSLIVTNASQVLGGARCAIGLLEEDGGLVEMRATSTPQNGPPQATFALTEGVAGWVVATAKPALIGDVRHDPRFKQLNRESTIASIMGVPLIADGRAIGALCATSSEPRAFRPDDLDLLSAFADQAAMAVKNARLYERVDSARREAEGTLQQIMALNDVARALVSTLNVEETLSLIVERLVSLARTSHCAVALLDERSALLEGRAVFGPADGDGQSNRRPFHIQVEEESAVARALHERCPVAVHNALASPAPAQRAFAERWGVQSYLITPLISRDTVIGAIYLGDNRPDFSFGEAERELTISFGSFAATAIQNARLYQDVREKSHELEAVVHGIGDGVLVTDPALRLLITNPIAANIFGLSEEVAPGTPLAEIVPHRGLVELVETTLASRHDDPMLGEVTVRTGRTGEERVYQALSAPVAGADGRPRGVVTVLRDITAQKELERMKSNFLSVISHELKTPLHSIKGFVDIILMGKTGEINELQRDFLSTVKDQTGQLQTLIQDLLEFSRLESGQLKLRPEVFDIAELAQRVVDKLAPVAAESEVEMVSQLPLPSADIEADPVRIEQVLSNLCDNAIKFTPPQGRVTISFHDRGETVELTVSDTGIGIPEHELDRIFDRFYQVDGSSTRRYRGTGLGLTICKHIIDHHGGRIWVESSAEAGSTFHIVLPKQLPETETLTIDFARLHHRA